MEVLPGCENSVRVISVGVGKTGRVGPAIELINDLSYDLTPFQMTSDKVSNERIPNKNIFLPRVKFIDWKLLQALNKIEFPKQLGCNYMVLRPNSQKLLAALIIE